MTWHPNRRSHVDHVSQGRPAGVFAEHAQHRHGVFHGGLPHPCRGGVVLFQLDEPAGGARAALVRGRVRDQPGLPPAAHASRLQDVEGLRVLPGRLRHADARGRADFLGRDAPRPPSALRPRRRSAHAARRRVLGAHGVDPLRRHAPQQHRADVEVRARSRGRPVLSLAEQLSLRSAHARSASSCSPSAAGRWCCGAFSSGSSSACTPRGW